MKKKALHKDFRTEIKKSLNRFLSIFFIVALGVSFFAGIQSSAPDMRATGDYYFDDSGLMDMRVISTLGLTEDDLEALTEVEGVERVSGCYMEDVYCGEADARQVLHFESLPEDMNRLAAVRGDIPQRAGECFLDAAYAASQGYGVGDTIEITVSSEDDSSLRHRAYTISGYGYSPCYVSFNRGSTTLGTGSVNGFAYVVPEEFDSEVYSIAYLLAEDAGETTEFTDSYDDLIERVQDRVEGIADARCEIRYDEVMTEAQEKLDDARQEVEDGKQELADAKKELEDGRAEAESELAEAESELLDGERQLEEGKQELEDAKQELAEGEQEIADGEREIAQNEATLADGRNQLASALNTLNSGEAEYKSGLAEYESQSESASAELEKSQQQLDEGQAALDQGWAEYNENLAAFEAGEQQLTAAEQELTQQQAAYDEGVAALADGKAQYEAGMQQLAAGQAEYESQAQNLPQLESAVAQMNENIQQIQAGLEGANAAVQQYQAAYDAAAAALASSQAQMDEYRALKTNAETEIAGKEAERDAAAASKTDRENELTTANGNLQTLTEKESTDGLTPDEEGQKAALEAQIGTLTSEIAGLDSQIAALDGAITDLQSSIDSYDADIAALGPTLEAQAQAAGMAEQALGMAKEGLNQAQAAAENLPTLQEQLVKAQAGIDMINAGKQQLDQSSAQLAAAGQTIAENEAQLNSAAEQLAAGWQQLNEQKANLEPARAQLEEARTTLEASEQELKQGKKELKKGKKQLKKELKKAKAQLTSAREELDEGWAQYNASQRQIADGEQQLAAARQQLADARAQLEEGRQEIADGEQEIADNEKELEDGWKDYEEGKREAEEEIADGEREIADAEQEIADAEEEIADAEEELNDLRYPEWYVDNRSVLPEHSGFGENAERLSNIAKVVPLLFFLVAALISLTTMTRMVEEERTQIGTLKALGYSKAAIASKYLKYAFLATIGGSVFGALVGEKIFPWVIINAYGIMYHYLPQIVLDYNWNYALIATGAALLCTMGATLSACYRELLAVPAQLMRPPAPKQGKRVWLEYLPFIWRRLSFTWKSTVRNLFRYKKRFLMTVIGIGGCMGLLLVGYGLQDSIMDIGVLQFDELQLQDAMVILDTDASAQEQQELLDQVQADGRISESKRFFMQMQDVRKTGASDKQWSVYVYVPEDLQDIENFFCFRDRETKEPYALTDEGAILTEKIARKLDIQPGDTITLEREDEDDVEIPVAAVCENYLSHYLYLTPALYEKVYGETPEYNSVFLRSGEEQDVIEEVGESLLEQDAVLNITYTGTMAEQIDNMLGALDVVMIVIIVSAGMLAFVVLYNLNNININERRRELATLKVLGFYNGEVAAYVYRENVLLTLIGTALGIFIGKFLHAFVITTVEVDACMFGRNINPPSFVYGSLFTIGFSVIVNGVMYFKLKKIDMVESLKSIE